MAEERQERKPAEHSSGSGRPSGPPRGPGRGPGGRGKGKPIRRRVCRLCVDRGGHVDWKAVNTLRNFVTDRGKILSGRQTATCAACQRKVTKAVKTAQMMALLPVKG